MPLTVTKYASNLLYCNITFNNLEIYKMINDISSDFV